jgi:hypothetical protein
MRYNFLPVVFFLNTYTRRRRDTRYYCASNVVLLLYLIHNIIAIVYVTHPKYTVGEKEPVPETV